MNNVGIEELINALAEFRRSNNLNRDFSVEEYVYAMMALINRLTKS